MQKQNLKERKIKMGRVKSYYFDNLENDIGIDEDTMQEDEKLVFEEQFGNDDVSTDIDLDRDIPDFDGTWKAFDEIWESKNSGDE